MKPHNKMQHAGMGFLSIYFKKQQVLKNDSKGSYVNQETSAPNTISIIALQFKGQPSPCGL